VRGRRLDAGTGVGGAAAAAGASFAVCLAVLALACDGPRPQDHAAMAADFFPDAESSSRAPPIPARDAAADASSGQVPYRSQAFHCVRGPIDAGPGYGGGGTLDAEPTDGGTSDESDAMEPLLAPEAGAYPLVTALPQITDFGGPRMTAPTVIPITYAGDPLVAQIEDAVASIGCTDYWHSVVSEYGIGDAVSGTPVHLPDAAPATIDDKDIASFLVQQIDDEAPGFPRPEGQTLYVFFYDDSTTVTESTSSPIQKSCTDFGGYHSETKLADGTPVVYAIVARCAQWSASFGVADPSADELASVTGVLSHEMVEAATDPRIFTAPALYLTDTNHFAWVYQSLDEIADLCSAQDDSWFVPSDLPWYVTHVWSNRAAAAGQSPCAPTTSTAYTYAAPVFDQTFSLLIPSLPRMDVGTVHIPNGASTTIPVALVSNYASGPINVQAYDSASLLGGTARLSLSFDTNTGMPGDTLNLTIAKLSSDPSGVDTFYLFTYASGRESTSIGMTDP
jgi:hypothetical protein